MGAGRQPNMMRRGSPISASWLNDIAQSVVRRITGSGGIIVRRVGGNAVLSIDAAALRQRRAMFPVKIAYDGGDDGTGTTAAAYTYTVTSLGGTELGTGISVVKPRPNGSMTYQTGDDAYGVAFYDGTDLKLWDAGELPGTTECAT
jgi:hypothetical protein